MSKNQSRGKYLLERVESIIIEGVKLLGNILLSEIYQ